MKTVTTVFAVVEAPLAAPALESFAKHTLEVYFTKLCGMDPEKLKVTTERPFGPLTQEEVTMLLDGLEASTPHLTIRELGVKQGLINKLAGYLPDGAPRG